MPALQHGTTCVVMFLCCADLRVLVHHAGDPDAWEAMLFTNTLGPMRLTRHLASAMAQRSAGLVVTTGSLAGTFASASSAPYCASKWGVRGWVLAAHEVRLQGL